MSQYSNEEERFETAFKTRSYKTRCPRYWEWGVRKKAKPETNGRQL